MGSRSSSEERMTSSSSASGIPTPTRYFLTRVAFVFHSSKIVISNCFEAESRWLADHRATLGHDDGVSDPKGVET